jgi:hypothetical protein
VLAIFSMTDSTIGMHDRVVLPADSDKTIPAEGFYAMQRIASSA